MKIAICTLSMMTAATLNAAELGPKPTDTAYAGIADQNDAGLAVERGPEVALPTAEMPASQSVSAPGARTIDDLPATEAPAAPSVSVPLANSGVIDTLIPPTPQVTQTEKVAPVTIPDTAANPPTIDTPIAVAAPLTPNASKPVVKKSKKKRLKRKTISRRRSIYERSQEGTNDYMKERNRQRKLGERLRVEVQLGNLDEVVKLLDQGADPNSRIDDQTLLFILARSNTPIPHASEIAKLLITRGAEVDAKDCLGNTPLFWAVVNQKNEVVKVLIDNGAKMEEKSGNKVFGAIRGVQSLFSSDTNKTFKEYKTNAKKKDANGRTALHDAADQGDAEKAKLLLAQTAKPNAKDNQGDTPLHLAAKKGSANVVEVLLANQETKPNEKDKNKDTALHLAAANGHVEVIKTLLRHPKIDAKAKDKNGKTPMDLAAGTQNKEVVELLLPHTY